MKYIKKSICYYWCKLPEIPYFGDVMPYSVGGSFGLLSVFFYIISVVNLLYVNDVNRTCFSEFVLWGSMSSYYIGGLIGYIFKKDFYLIREKYKYKEGTPAFIIFYTSFILFVLTCFI